VDISFTEPRFLGRDVAAGLDIYGYKYDLSEYSSYKTTTYGTTMRASFPLSLNSRGSTRYVLRQDQIEIANSELFCVGAPDDPSTPEYDPLLPSLSQALCGQIGKKLTSLFGYGYRMDRRNDYLNPTRGFYFDLQQDVAGLGGDVNYVLTEIEGGWYHGFTKDFILSVTGPAASSPAGRATASASTIASTRAARRSAALRRRASVRAICRTPAAIRWAVRPTRSATSS
jgi:outer membrane protein insertion porin family